MAKAWLTLAVLAVVSGLVGGAAGLLVQGQSPVPTPAHSPVATPAGPGVPTGFTPTPVATPTPTQGPGGGDSARVVVTRVVLPVTGAAYTDGWRAGFGRLLVGILVVIAAAVVGVGLADWLGWFDKFA